MRPFSAASESLLRTTSTAEREKHRTRIFSALVCSPLIIWMIFSIKVHVLPVPGPAFTMLRSAGSASMISSCVVSLKELKSIFLTSAGWDIGWTGFWTTNGSSGLFSAGVGVPDSPACFCSGVSPANSFAAAPASPSSDARFFRAASSNSKIAGWALLFSSCIANSEGSKSGRQLWKWLHFVLRHLQTTCSCPCWSLIVPQG